MEIPLEEDYWPLIEKDLNNPPTSFFRFGWKHFNIYNLSSALLILLLGCFYFLRSDEKPQKEKISAPANNIIQGDSQVIYKEPSTNKKEPAKNNVITKNKKTNRAEFSSDITIEKDSVIVNTPKEEATNPSSNPESPKVPVEEKVKPKSKRIIYVVQQDTIVEKDTVKVRRKRKK